MAGNVKNQSVAALLAAFVGGFGIHRFYLSRPISGVFYLLFCWTGIPGLIALVETFVYAFMSPENWARKYNNGLVSAPVHIAIRILVLIFPLVFVAGMLAAIAIPAYQSYVNKARAARSSVQIDAPRHAGTVAMRATLIVPASAA